MCDQPRSRSGRGPRALRRAALLAALALVALAVNAAANAPANAAAKAASVVVGARPLALAGAVPLGPLAPATGLRLTLALRSRDPAGLAALAAAVSDPTSSSYHRYLSVGEFAARFGADRAGVAALRRTLRREGLRPGALSPNGLSLPVSASAAQASRAFGVTLRRYRTRAGARLYGNTAAPRMTAASAGIVAEVLGLSNARVAEPAGLVNGPSMPAWHAPELPAAHRQAKALAHAASSPFPGGGGPQPCSDATGFRAIYPQFYTLDQVAQAYRMDGLYAQGDFGQGVTVALFELDRYASTSWMATDLAAFQACYGTSAQVSLQPLIDGGGTPTDTAETAVDVQNVIALAPQAKVEVYEGPNTLSGRYDTLARIVQDNTAQVISDSWGLCEQEDTLDVQIEANLLAEAAVQGETFISSTGDRGAEGCASEWNDNLTDIGPGLDQQNNANFPNGDLNAPSLAVEDPASQPYATAVGGTNLLSAGPPPHETAWDHLYWGASGGGISTQWHMPGWQQNAGVPGVVNGYSTATPCAGSSDGLSGYCREVPDVAANGSTETGYVTYFEGAWDAFGGTSTSAPVWAALAALTDSALAGTSSVAGCTPGAQATPPSHTKLGFMNPLLYEIAAGDDHAHAFNDITVGDNSGYFSGTTPYGSYPSGPYPATPGYDMTTGLGTPIASDGSSPGLVAQLCAASETPIGAAPAITTLANPEASPGSTVTINGSGFTRYTAVWFGNTVATAVNDLSPTQLVATVPPGDGSVHIRLAGLAGWSATGAGDVFTYAPTETISSPVSGATYTQGQALSASYSCAAAGTAPACSGSAANGGQVDTASVGVHHFTVTATDANGFSTSTTASYTVVAPPVVAINGPAPGGVYAQGDLLSAEFSCAATAPATITSCTATVAPGTAIDTGTPGSHTFTVAATDSNGVRSTVTASYTVVASLPTLSGLHQAAARWLERASRRMRLPLGTTFSFSLDQSAHVTLSFTRLATGRLASGRCVAPARAKPRARRCTRRLPAGTLGLAGQPGANTVSFSGRTSIGALPAGSYSVVLRATGISGRPSAPVSLLFTIAAPKH